ncbi:phospho-N-acetylmuramoyl-pentapeptide-transferase [Thermoflexibacter ruber]|uniref:Phospho-N-acetylmuramoyl-pentapeptide-transferase n=1 Tax=Thermoflexibacter ruber TaxID=1003 RepID=A0A1I2HWX7_9BACT|nr:phospho-N-acetylmuramoyl-pentapeptide-transferase [Thermoflexibacter ruber]SFF33257.1 Phospho-N-acetylmuramoyl-pentapeptide-transferase [Thermoflexibacter ruber]
MLYYLFQYLDEQFNLPGAGLFQYITFRASMAAVLSLLIVAIFGRKIINYLQKQQVGEVIRDLGLEGQMQKKGTPTMGGIIIIIAILIPTLLFTRLTNVYIVLLIITLLFAGFIGFVDDYIKVFKKDKEGLKGRFKVIGQIILGLVVGITLYVNDNVVVRQFDKSKGNNVVELLQKGYYQDVKSSITTIPFFKFNEFDYHDLVFFLDSEWTWVIYIPFVIFIITAVSNGANITDGLDGLAAGTSAIIGVVLAVFAYVSGNAIFANYLNVMFIPHTGELAIFATVFVGACIGFLWYNSYPAQVFMGDTGSLTLGALIATLAIMVRKEVMIPILCGIFLVENLSVMIQVAYFKYTKKKYGEGRRIFLMSPLHHHFQKKQIHEVKIVTRFWIVGIMLAIFCLVSLKIR